MLPSFHCHLIQYHHDVIHLKNHGLLFLIIRSFLPRNDKAANEQIHLISCLELYSDPEVHAPFTHWFFEERIELA